MDEQVKQRVLISVAVCNVAAFAYSMIFNNGFFSYDATAVTYSKVMIAVVVGLVCGGITFGVLTAIKKP